MNIYTLSKDFLAYRPCSGALLGIESHVILISLEDYLAAEKEISNGILSWLALPSGASVLSISTAEQGIESEVELDKRSYGSLWIHKLQIRLFDKNESIKGALKQLSMDRMVAIVCNKGKDEQTKYELFGASSGLIVSEMNSSSSEGDSVMFDFKLESPNTVGESALPLSVFTGDLQTTTLLVDTLLSDAEAFIFELSLTEETLTQTLPIYGEYDYDFEVKWEDEYLPVKGTDDANASHQFATPGIKRIAIKGKMPAFSYHASHLTVSSVINDETISVYSPLVRVLNWGNTHLETCNAMFEGCISLSSLPKRTGIVFADCADFDRMFCNTNIAALPDDLFLNAPQAISFNFTFQGCSKLSVIPLTLFAKNSQVISFQGTFYKSGLTAIPRGLFNGCPLVQYFTNVFRGTSLLEAIYSPIWNNCQEVLSMEGCFSQSGISALYVNGFFANKPHCTTFESCFKECLNLQGIGKRLFSEATSATNFDCAFMDCSNLEKIGFDLFEGCSSIESVSNLFGNCTQLTGELPPDIFSTGEHISNFRQAFRNCSLLNGEAPSIGGTKLWLLEKEISSYHKTGTFEGCIGLRDYSEIPDDWK